MKPSRPHLDFDDLEDLLSERLDQPGRRRVEAHLAGCGECRERLDSTAANLGAEEWIAGGFPAEMAAQEAGPVSSVSVPERLGHFRVVRELGRGGRGAIYLAEDTRLGREVALKILARGVTGEHWHDLQAEARALAALDHPHVARVYSLDIFEGRAVLCMERVQGETLASRLQRGPLPLPTALTILRCVAAGLDAAHRRGLVHRDLKPANVVLSPAGTKIVDFGLARFLDDGETGTFEVAGTPGFMSPEQVRGEPVDERADVWAFGCLLYACLTAAPPFGGAEAADRWAATLESDPDWAALAGTPAAVQSLVRSCLQKDAHLRPGSGSDLLERLNRCTGEPVEHTRVPGLPNSWVGRTRELTQLVRCAESSRLVTIVGVGGIGKSRLAREFVRAHSRDRVFWLELAPLDPQAQFLDVIAPMLGADVMPQESVASSILRRLIEEPTLLVLDNCEHVIEACAPWVFRLLTDARTERGLRILATSREPLRVSGETTLGLSGLNLPDEARALFEARAHDAVPSLTFTEDDRIRIDSICRRLDGIPLALELAAANLRRLPLDEIERRLKDDLGGLGATRDPLQHHRTLEALFDWSYERLLPDERRVFSQLSTFRGGWTVEAARNVVSAGERESPEWWISDVLARLTDRSMIELRTARDDSAAEGWRYRMLEPVRLFAAARHPEPAAGRARHRRYYADFARNQSRQLTGPGQAPALRALAVEMDNLRAALRSCLECSDATTGLRLTAALGRFWQNRGWITEGVSWCREVIQLAERERATSPDGTESGGEALPSNDDADAGRAHVTTLVFGSALSGVCGETETAHRWIAEGERLARLTGWEHGLAMVWNAEGGLALQEGRRPHARACYARALDVRRRLSDTWGVASLLNNLAVIDLEDGDFASSRSLAEECLQLREEVGDENGVCMALINLANIDIREGTLDRAASHLQRGREIASSLDNVLALSTIEYNLGRIALKTQRVEDAKAHFLRSRDLHRSRKAAVGEAFALEGLAEISRAEGDAASVEALLSRAIRLYGEVGDGGNAERLRAQLTAYRASGSSSGD